MTSCLISKRVGEHWHTVATAANNQFTGRQRIGQQVVIGHQILEVGPCFGDAVSGPHKLNIGSSQCDAFHHDETENVFIMGSAAISLLRLDDDQRIAIDDFQ